MDVTKDECSNYEKLHFKLEVLKARLEIKNFFLNNFVKEVYENIGQLLSTAKMQIDVFDPAEEYTSVEDLKTSGELIGVSIRELRKMTKGFHADEELLKEEGIFSQLAYLIDILGFKAGVTNDETFSEELLTSDFQLITFKLLLEILISIKQLKAELRCISLSHKNGSIVYVIKYNDPIYIMDVQHEEDENIAEVKRVLKIIDGSYSIQRNESDYEIFLRIPSNTNHE